MHIEERHTITYNLTQAEVSEAIIQYLRTKGKMIPNITLSLQLYPDTYPKTETNAGTVLSAVYPVVPLAVSQE